TLEGQVHDLYRQTSNPGRQAGMTGAMSGTGASGGTGARGDGAVGDQPGSASSDSDRGAIQTGGGRSLSRAAGGDPTATGQAQEVGNLHLGKVSLNAYYDFHNAGFHLDTPDKEFTFGVTGMTQLDGVLYVRPTPGAATSGFYNPRSRIYFE